MSEADQVIDGLGGTAAVAELCEITTSAVSQWRSNGIPAYRMAYFRLLRPDLFADARDAGGTETEVAA